MHSDARISDLYAFAVKSKTIRNLWFDAAAADAQTHLDNISSWT